MALGPKAAAMIIEATETGKWPDGFKPESDPKALADPAHPKGGRLSERGGPNLYFPPANSTGRGLRGCEPIMLFRNHRAADLQASAY